MKNTLKLGGALVLSALLSTNLLAKEGESMQELIKQGSLESFKGSDKVFSGKVNVEMMFQG